MALETGGLRLRGLDRVVVRAVRILHERALIALAPVVFVLALVVVAGLGDADLEEVVVRRAQQRVRGDEAAARVAPHRGLVDVDPRILLRELLHAGDLIGNRVVTAHRAVVRVGERLRSIRRAGAVDADDDEAEFGERLLVAARRGERARADAARLRPGIRVVDDRILLVRIEVRRPEEHAVDVRLAVGGRHLDLHRRLPAGRERASRCRPSRAA